MKWNWTRWLSISNPTSSGSYEPKTTNAAHLNNDRKPSKWAVGDCDLHAQPTLSAPSATAVQPPKKGALVQITAFVVVARQQDRPRALF